MFWAEYRRPLLFLVYVVFFAHAAVWYWLGYDKVGHLGFGEFFETLKHGIVTAGTVFSILVFVHALFFGGLFCGWFCHWGITQDLSSWILRRLGINHPMVNLRSRLLPWLWFLVILGQVGLFWFFQGLPTSFSVNLGATPMWSGVPRSIFMICITTVVSGFLLILLFGERAFCRTVCTFRLWFSWFERLSKHKIRQIKPCSICEEECTQACPMGLPVAAEIKTLGLIRNQECVKCFKCIKACPHGTIQAGFSKNEFEKQGAQIVPPSALHPSIIRLQALFGVVVLALFCRSIGGNMSLSIAFLVGFFLVFMLKTRQISKLAVLAIVALPFGYHFSGDLNDLTSTLKGLVFLAGFLFIAKHFVFKSEREFIAAEAANTKVSPVLTTIVALLALALGGRELFFRTQFYRAAEAFATQDMARYTEIMDKYADFHGNQVAVYFDLGQAYMTLKQPELAIERFKKSLELSYSVNVAQGMLEKLASEGCYKETINFAEYLQDKYVQDRDQFTVAVAFAKLGLGNFAEAEKEFATIINLDSTPLSAIVAFAELKLSFGKSAEAKEVLLKNIASSPDPLVTMLSQIYLNENETEKAVALLEKHLPANRELYLRPLVAAYIRNGDSQKAEALLKQEIAAVSQDPDPALFFFLGGTLADQKRFQEAIETWSKVPKEFSAYDAAQENIARARRILDNNESFPGE